MKNKMSQYKVCKRCIMDTSDPNIAFNNEGVCNHCLNYDIELPKRVFSGELAEQKLKELIRRIKIEGKDREYDCIVGVSGGVDSTYVAYTVKKLGLRPLAIHFDNGWNSELAVSNIELTLRKLDIDLMTFVMDWPEFKSLQRSFLKASTPDGEVPTDHAINALLFREAKRLKIKYIISGMNFSTESMNVTAWSYGHSDWKYIRSVNRIFENVKLNSYPHYSLFNLFWWTFINKIRSVSILNYIPYNKESVMQTLKDELGWVYYGGKHYESIYTRFFQGYILPNKFNIDKRRGHLSDLIRSNQLSREYALIELEKSDYSKELQIQDKIFVTKKLEFTEAEFDKIMLSPPKSFLEYPNNYSIIKIVKRLVNYLRLKGIYHK